MNIQEKKEINILLNKGFNFNIQYKEKKSFWRSLFQGKTAEIKTKTLEFREPTLAVLDLATDLFLNINAETDDKNDLKKTFKTVKENADKMAKIVAVFALGEDCFEYSGNRYKIKEKQISELANLIFLNLKPSELEHITMLMTALSNLPDFLTSIRLLGASRTTQPAHLVE